MFKFFTKLISYLYTAKNDPSAKRTREKIKNDPDGAVKSLTRVLGSDTGLIRLEQLREKPKSGNFSFIALNANGEEVNDTVDAIDEASAINAVRKQGLYPTAVRPGTQGFTLIELLVVITIIGIIGSLVVGLFFGSDQQRENIDVVSPEQVIFELQQTVTELRAENTNLQKLLLMKADWQKQQK